MAFIYLVIWFPKKIYKICVKIKTYNGIIKKAIRVYDLILVFNKLKTQIQYY